MLFRSANPSCAANSTFWGGDQACNWSDFQRVVRSGLSAALSGYPFWGHDIGGYAGVPTKNLYIRWLELGALSPIMQLHGTTPREPWYYDDETIQIAKYYFDLRWKLRDYVLAAAKAAREDAVPMWRPLLYEFPDDPATYNLDDEFLFGPDLLVAPVLSESDERKVYLPAGEWVDVWTKEKHTGPKTFTVRPKLAEIPVFARHGAESYFPSPGGPRADYIMKFGGATNERGIVPTQRLIRGQKYEKIFLSVQNCRASPVMHQVSLSLPAGFSVLPDAKQSGILPAGGTVRLAFYVSLPSDLPVGTYGIGVGGVPAMFTIVKPPDWKLPVREDGYVDLGKESEATASVQIGRASCRERV